MTLTVVLWLASGIGLAVIAWLAAPASFPAGEVSCVIAGVGGAFVGGELFVVLSGPVHEQPAILTLLGSVAGGLLCLDLATQAAASQAPLPGSRLSRTWLWLVLWSPVIFAVAIGAALARANQSPVLGLAAAVSVVLFVRVLAAVQPAARPRAMSWQRMPSASARHRRDVACRGWCGRPSRCCARGRRCADARRGARPAAQRPAQAGDGRSARRRERSKRPAGTRATYRPRTAKGDR